MFQLTVILALATVQQGVLISDLYLPVSDSQFHEENRRTEGETYISYRRVVDHAGLRGSIHEPRDLNDFWARDTNMARRDLDGPDPAPSQMPLGDRVKYSHSVGSEQVRAQLGRFHVRMRLGYVGNGPIGNVVWNKHDPEGDLELVEGLARYALARACGRTLSAAGNQTISGTQITNAMATEGGTIMVRLADWAGAHGIPVSFNERMGTASFTRNERQWVVPLAASSVKIGESWSALPAPTVRANGHTYVPLARFEELLR